MPESALPDHSVQHGPACLGVTRSVLGRHWRERLGPAETLIATAITQTHGFPDMLGRVLAGRGIGLSDAASFVAPRLRDLMPDPSRLIAMDEASERLADAVERRERVAIFGDYDVDGACSAALLAEYLGVAGVPFAIHIPDRITEGYGPNAEAIRRLAREGARLLVTVDCGTTSHEPLAEAARLGLDTLVIDHHQAPEELPPAIAIVNPNRADDLSGLGHLCAAAIVFLTLVALTRALRRRGFWAARPEPDLLAALDLVALATVADVVPLTGLNRAFVRQGLAVMRQRRRIGLAALADVARLDGAPEAWHLGYLLGPRINAGGRIGDASLGTKLLLEQDATKAQHIAASLESLNRDRQVIEQEAVAEAESQADAILAGNPEAPILVTASPEWHPGVVGLVASRLKERFGRPAFAFAIRSDGCATGSGRSVAGVDLGRAVRAAVTAGVATKGGGHAMAAGATLSEDGLEPFRRFVCERLSSGLAELDEPDLLLIDSLLSAGGARPELITTVERAGPFGSGQPEPIFGFAQHRVAEAAYVGTAHVRFSLKSGDGAALRGIAFRAAGQPLGVALMGAIGRPVHAAGTLVIDRWGGGEKAQLRLVDIALPE